MEMKKVKDQVVEEINYLVDEGEHQFEFEAPENLVEYVVTLDGTLLKHFKSADEALEFLDNFNGFVDVEEWEIKSAFTERYPKEEYPHMYKLEIEFPVCIVNLDSSALEARDKSLLDELLTDEQLSDILGYTVERFTDEQILSLCQNGKTVVDTIAGRGMPFINGSFGCYVIKEVTYRLKGHINALEIRAVRDVAVVRTCAEAQEMVKSVSPYQIYVYDHRVIKSETSFCLDCKYFEEGALGKPSRCILDITTAMDVGYDTKLAESYAKRRPTDTCPRFKRATQEA